MKTAFGLLAIVFSVSIAFSQSTPSISPIKEGIRVSKQFGEVQDTTNGIVRKHNGIDFTTVDGTPVLATGDGSVVQAAKVDKYGLMIKLTHTKDLQTVYAHLSKLNVKKGDHVKCGQVIGYSGHSGKSTFPHLHYEVLISGKNVDPIAYIQ